MLASLCMKLIYWRQHVRLPQKVAIPMPVDVMVANNLMLLQWLWSNRLTLLQMMK